MISAVRHMAYVALYAVAVGFWNALVWSGAIVLGHYAFLATKIILPDMLAAIIGMYVMIGAINFVEWATGQELDKS